MATLSEQFDQFMETVEFPSTHDPIATGPQATYAANTLPRLVNVEPVIEFQVVSFDCLTHEDAACWERIRAAQAEFQTPFFSFAFSRAVHAVRNNVLVAVLKRHHDVVGYLPFHRVKSIAHPVARRFNDAHGVIARPETVFSWSALIEAMQCKGFEFHSLVGADRQRLPTGSIVGTVGSYCSTLGDDSAASLKRLEVEHRTIAKQGQKTRKLAREVGSVRLEVDCRCEKLLADAIERKREHYRRTNILDLFLAPWTSELIRTLARHEPNESRVMLSLLWAGDNVVASHIGLRDGDLLHYWFPAYDCAYSKYSPGTALFKELARVASDHGITAIDMGFGEQPYKRKQTDVQSDVAYGFASESSLRRSLYRIGLTRQRLLKSLPMKESLKFVLRRLHPKAGFSDFH